MDQERFDQLARKISSASTRRTMLGGMVAGLFGAGIAKLGDAAAKTGKTKHKQVKTHKSSDKNKKGKDGAVHKEQVVLCAGVGADPVSCPNGCCTGGLPNLCVANGQGGFCGRNGQTCTIAGPGQCCDPISGTPIIPPAANPANGVPGTCGTGSVAPAGLGSLCTACPAGCCAQPDPLAGQFGTQCKANGAGNCGIKGVACNLAASGCVAANAQNECCKADGTCGVGTPGTVTQCGSGRLLCKTCTGTNATCITGTCQADALCPAPQTSCIINSVPTCVDLGNNTANCGACGKACPACPTGTNAVCTGGTCGCTAPPPTCPVGLVDCSGVCANLSTNPSNCGKCGTVCPACGKGQSILCNGGACGCSQKKKKKKHHHHHHH